MNKQQLQSARLQRWSQNNNARLTLEDALGWLRETGLCALAPQATPASHAAPTLLEALHGKPMLATTLEERATLNALLARMVQSKSAVPLLLSGPVGEQPDFVSTLDALPMLYTLRGDRNWRVPPVLTGQRKVSNLALHVWQAIEKDGPQTVAALQSAMSGDLTAAALLRALCELWGQLRVMPLLQVDDAGVPVDAAWELLSRRHAKQVSMGAAMGQPEALSGLLAFYLSTVFAASDEEIVAHLAPLASHAKVREMVHGLIAMRQLARTPCEGALLLHLKDGLSEELLVELEPVVPVQTVSAPMSDARPQFAQAPPRVWRERSVPQIQAKQAQDGDAPAARGEGFVRRGPKPPFAPRREEGRESTARPPRREFAPRQGAPQRGGTERGAWDRGDKGRGGKTFGGWKRPERREGSGSERRSEGQSGGGSGEWRQNRPADARPFARPNAGPNAGSDAPRDAGIERTARPPRKEFGSRPQRPAYGAASRPSGGFGPKKFGDKKFGDKKFGDKKFGDKKFGGGRAGAFGDKKFGDKKFGGDRPERRDRPDRDRQDARPPRRAEGEGFVRRESRGTGSGDFRQRSAAPPWKRAAGAPERPERREKRPYGDRPSGPRRDAGARGPARGGPRRSDARGPARDSARSPRPRPEGGFEQGGERRPTRRPEGRPERRPEGRPQGRPEGGAKRFGKPGMGKPRTGAPRDGKPSFGRPGGGKGGFRKPGFGKPSFRKPGAGRPAAGGRSAGPRRTDGPVRQQRPRPAPVKRKKPGDDGE